LPYDAPGSHKTFVLRKAILWILNTQTNHQSITGGFCKDGGGCDAQRPLVAFDQRSL
jgi:hypothetical protein